MSDNQRDDTDFDDKTAIRQEPNDDKTAVKGRPRDEDAAPSDDAGSDTAEGDDAAVRDETVVRKKSPETSPNDDATILRSGSASSQADDDVNDGSAGNDSATIVRGERPAPAGDDDATVIKETRKEPPASSGNATILRSSRDESKGSPEAGNENATVLRGAGAPSNENATILRGSGAPQNEHATILRGGDGGNDSTVLRDGGGDATVMRGGGDNDRTVINDGQDDDKTVMGGERGEDTTYVATNVGGGKSERNRGNSEAGRLLKNRFVLEEKVGSGGMGDVYKALDLRQQEAQERNPYIAIKILNDDFARHKDAFISLQREATRTRGIPHPNIMAVYDFDREGETVFMSMELLDGKPLDDYLRDHPEGVSVEDAWNIIDGICQGLSRAHGAGIVHSDFKPGNIYYCADKTAKVFDFGIARAVQSPGDIRADGEKTVFDAGSLGALTPTYASYEMLVGKDPTKSDDVYAVALVAYELFTGKHPYNRTPADKALERGLEPEPVKFLKRRHWRALKKGLALKGEDRYQSIDEFYADMFSEDPPYFRYAAIAAVLVASIGFGVYNFMYGGEEIPEEYQQLAGRLDASKGFLREELGELDINVAVLQADPTNDWNFESQDWRESIRLNLRRAGLADIELSGKFSDYYQHGEGSDPDIARWKQRVLEIYLAEIAEIREQADEVADAAVEEPVNADPLLRLEVERERAEALIAELRRADVLLEEAKTDYYFDPNAIANAESRLDVELTLATDELQDVSEDIATEVARIEAEQAEQERLAQEADRVARRNATYLALREGEQDSPQSLREILKCKGDLTEEDLLDLETVLNGPGTISVEGYDQALPHQGLRGTFPEQFELDRPGIVQALTGCISSRIAVRAPDRAREVRTRVQSMLPPADSAQIAGIVIEDLDPCAKRNLEGRGSMNGSWCSDQLSVGGFGPELVVLPKQPGEDEKFAISRIEVKRSDYNRFCEESGCAQLDGAGTLPVTNISLSQARAYAAWLSDQTGREYRLPTVEEWRYAARTNREEPLDDNVNCTVDARGVRLGDKLLSTLSGRPNRWGLYNFVGNAREWAVDPESDGLVALGGAHTDPKSECTLEKQVAHSGNPDPVTGFRIVRSVEG